VKEFYNARSYDDHCLCRCLRILHAPAVADAAIDEESKTPKKFDVESVVAHVGIGNASDILASLPFLLG
jgi:hypothetical protein